MKTTKRCLAFLSAATIMLIERHLQDAVSQQPPVHYPARMFPMQAEEIFRQVTTVRRKSFNGEH